MNPGSVFFDTNFEYHNGGTGKKLIVVLGTKDNVSVVALTTSQQKGRGTVYGCQPKDRYHNFYLPLKSCALDLDTWVCLDDFYDLSPTAMLKRAMDGIVHPICTLPQHLRALQECAMASEDISISQHAIVKACLV